MISRLAGRYRCLAADAPGFGESSDSDVDSDVEGYTVEEMTQQVLELVASFEGEYVLVGHSMMGKVSMVAASRKPERLRGVVLVAPSPLVPEPMTEAARATMVVGNESRETALEFFVKGAKTELDAETQRIGVADVLRANPVAWRRWPQSGTREDWSGAISPLTLPSLLVVGEFDEAIPADFQREHTLPKLAQGQMELVKGVAHLIPYEAPGELAGLIDRFVAGLVG
ncbi:alpha/beta hydrolase [soil metagenome]